MYQQLIDVIDQKGEIFRLPKCQDDMKDAELQCLLNKDTVQVLFTQMAKTNYKQFEATLRIGSCRKFNSPILIWPPPMPHTTNDLFGCETTKMVSRELEICGFLNLSDIGSPMSVSRHLIFSKDADKLNRTRNYEFEKLYADVLNYYRRTEDNEDSDPSHKEPKESACVLLHGALKVENMAALTLLNDNWYGFIYSYADSKKKSNLMLNILSPGK